MIEDRPIVTQIDPQTLTPKKPVQTMPDSGQTGVFALFIGIIIAGLITGYFLSGRNAATGGTDNTVATGKDMVKTATEIGSTDTKTFSDSAQGLLEKGGIKNEGTHRLTRPGGVTQTVYLVSSVVDLDTYVDKKVEVWGQTLKAKNAGWLMDVGRLKILE